MIQFISSYLFDEPTHLNSFYDRLSNKTSETWTLQEIPGRRFAADLPVYVLTSSYTGSAAEEFTYNLKHLKRATIMGETTGGAAHPVVERVINDRFRMLVPYARAENPITKTNWEGVGVIPHIKVSAANVLNAAREDAAKKISALQSRRG
jgi:C-terminal processing protease CtpA/Prc